MTTVEDPTQTRTRRGPRWWLVLPPLTSLAAAAVFAMALLDTATATGEAGMRSLAFGLPLDWLTQNQESHDPPYPYAPSPESPWENPTSIALTPFVVDVLAVLAVLLVAWLGVRLALRRR